MQSINEVPEIVRSMLSENGEVAAELWGWLSSAHYAALVEQNGDDLLVFVEKAVDFAGMEAACAGFRVYSGQRGQAASYTIGQLCRVLTVKYLKNWSYRQTEAEVRGNSLMRWFVGYGLREATLDHMTLWRFEQWVKGHDQRIFFDEILKQIDQARPGEAKREQVGDTFALVSRAKEQSRTEQLRGAVRQILPCLATATASGYSVVLAGIDWSALFGGEGEQPERFLEKVERDALELRTARAAHECLRLVNGQRQLLGAGSAYAALEQWAGVLAKILHDEFVITTDASGRASAVQHHSEKVKGNYRHGSMVDLAATFRQHGDKCQLGYNGHVAASPDFVREINAGLGAAPDSTGVANLIAQQKEQLGLVPVKLIYDRAAGMPKIFHAVSKASEGQTQLVARLIDYSKSRARFGPLDFTLNEDHSLTCPNGQSTNTRYRSGDGDGWNYRFTAQQCTGCPLWQQCRGEKTVEPATSEQSLAAADQATVQPTSAERTPAEATPVVSTASNTSTTATLATPVANGKARQPKAERKPSKPRTPKADAYRQVFISDYRSLQQAAIAYTKTEPFKLDMKLRSNIERIIACLVRYNGARQATGYGLANADFQLKMCAMAFNLKRWHTLTLAEEKAKRVRPKRT